jgi:hypothetical protein
VATYFSSAAAPLRLVVAQTWAIRDYLGPICPGLTPNGSTALAPTVAEATSEWSLWPRSVTAKGSVLAAVH